MSYENWYEENYNHMHIEFIEIKKSPWTDFYEFGDYVMEQWEEEIGSLEDSMQELGIEYEKNYKNDYFY